MKKVVTLVIASILIFMFGYVYAENTIEFEFKTINNEKNEDFDLYILLPEKYILYAIEQMTSDVYIEYDGANTLKNNQIPGINVKKENVQNELYEENGIKYVQILLNGENGIYKFDVLEDYIDMDIKYRIKNAQKDYILHIDSFKIKDKKCEMEYNYQLDTVKQPDRRIVSFNTILIILLIIIIMIGGMAYVKGRN